MSVCVGADWDWKKCVVTSSSEDASRYDRVLRDPSSVRTFVEQFGEREVMVGIEVGDSMWARLWEDAGARVFVFDAKQAKHYQKTLCSSGASDDKRSAQALCSMVQSQRHRNNAVPQPVVRNGFLSALCGGTRCSRTTTHACQ